jgi:hypothetical protein
MANHDAHDSFGKLGKWMLRASMKIIAASGVLVLVTLTAMDAEAGPVTLQVTSVPSAGETALSQEAMNALGFAADIWGGLLSSSYIGETVTINAVFGSTPPNALASGQPTARWFDPNLGWEQDDYYWFPISVANHLAGEDLNLIEPEIKITFNLTPPHGWDYGTAGAQSGYYDFVTTSLHEIAHGLGIVSGMSLDGPIFTIPNTTIGTGYIFDTFVYSDAVDTFLINATNANRSAMFTTSPIVFTGLSATIANGGDYPQLYAPSTFVQGSSIVHLDPNTELYDLMVPSMSTGYSNHMPSAIDLGILRGVGWYVPVPEPSTLLLLGTGSGLIVLAAYRRKKK